MSSASNFPLLSEYLGKLTFQVCIFTDITEMNISAYVHSLGKQPALGDFIIEGKMIKIGMPLPPKNEEPDGPTPTPVCVATHFSLRPLKAGLRLFSLYPLSIVFQN